MSTSTLAPEARRNVALFSGSEFGGAHGVKMYKKVKDDGTRLLVLEDVPVFRSGTFRDSMGFQHTWEPIHMAQMVTHFDLLRDQAIFADVPVRRGHGSFFGDPIDTLIGYHTGLRTEKRQSPSDGTEYTYLLAGFEILDPDAQEKIEKGLWRNRSSEVGGYTTNAEAEFWPVYQGFAYVDIPAVEGLNFEKAGVGTKFALMTENEEEAPVGTENNGNGAEQQGAENQEQNNGGGSTVDTGASSQSQTEVNPDEAAGQRLDEESGQETGSTNPANSGNATHGASRPASFRVNGREVTDPTAVQSHIDTLEQFQSEQRDAGRSAFVHSLVSDRKVTAPQEEGLNTLALSMSDEQFSQFKSVWESAPTLPLLESHAGGTSNHEGQTDDSVLSEKEKLEGIVKHHRQSGMSEEDIQKTPSYQRLQQLQQTA